MRSLQEGHVGRMGGHLSQIVIRLFDDCLEVDSALGDLVCPMNCIRALQLDETSLSSPCMVSLLARQLILLESESLLGVRALMSTLMVYDLITTILVLCYVNADWRVFWLLLPASRP